ncbi:MAG: Asp-tRNA(Asn)/Glu-tRNA(Gln) amidotransferase subunit GatA [Candidatus Omnitrophica bacterium]|nr:Asp-tRNA(Asn)/Glu-tRNA(Gln) amidotransferase subunit GatA [Candidatus Omnitrophota bacterium]
MNLHTLTAHALQELLLNRQVSPADIYRAVRGQIDLVEKKVGAFARLAPAPDFNGLADKPFPIPVALKDNLCISGQETTCASKILTGFRPPYDATVVRRLKEAGALIIGQANMDEFAFGSSTESSCYGPTKNPWDLTRVPGGSSGGAAAAVAAHETIWALGSDTGGSIRQPAAFCGIVGLKPTYGRVSRYGLIAFASSLDQIGPMTKDVTDAARLLKIIAGHDPLDATSVDLPVPDYTQSLRCEVKGMRVGIPREYFIAGLDPEVAEAVTAAIAVLKKQGAQIVDISLPHTPYAVATYYIVATAEASSNLGRYDGVRYGRRVRPPEIRQTPIIDMFEETRDQGFGEEAKRRIMLGTYALSAGYYDAYYLKGLKVRTLIKRDFDQAFQTVDAIVTPTAPTTAFKIGEKTADPLSMYLSDIYTISANLSGIPAISLPCGFSQAGLPIGLQIMAKPFAEETLFRVAFAYEQATGWHKRVCQI